MVVNYDSANSAEDHVHRPLVFCGSRSVSPRINSRFQSLDSKLRSDACTACFSLSKFLASLL